MDNSLVSRDGLLTSLLASILTRQWAKKYHHLYVDSSEQSSYAKDEQ